MSEVFWEIFEGFIDKYGNFQNLRAGFLPARENTYADSLTNEGCTLNICVGFIDCKKIRMTRPVRHNRNERSVYSGHKIMILLIEKNNTYHRWINILALRTTGKSST